MSPIPFVPSSVPLAGLINWICFAALLVVPILVILLYFLKLKRQPLEVPSTFLWHRTIEDMHVNSIWQKLRKSLLLFLQLLFLALVVLAIVRPGWSGTELVGKRFIFLIDTSASMNAVDGDTTRLAKAKQRAAELIDQMKTGDAGMIISFSNGARIEQSFTDSRSLLRRKLDEIQPTVRSTSLQEALLAADGLANPGRSSSDATDIPAPEPQPATLYILSDGGFDQVDFALGNLSAEYVPIGGENPPQNIAITTFSTEQNLEKPGQVQAFVELQNFGNEDVTVDMSLYFNGDLRDANELIVPKQATAAAEFSLIETELDPIEAGSLRLEVDHDDGLNIDNVAYAAMNPPRRARIALVTSQNDALQLALQTEAINELARIETLSPGALESRPHQEAAAAGEFDLIIYDRCVPQTMPEANTLFIAAKPPLERWKFGEVEDVPIIIDADRSHPLIYLLELGNVIIFEGFPIEPPSGGSILIDSNIGALMAIGPREGFEDAVLGFGFVGPDEEGRLEAKTDWPRKLSFPVFVQNVVSYLGGARSSITAPNVSPGEPVKLRSQLPVDRIAVTSPDGVQTELGREAQNTFVYSRTDEPGIYQVDELVEQSVRRRFAVNLFDRSESNLEVRPAVQIGHQEVQGEFTWEPSRNELWKVVLLVGLGILLFEWYVYNRRVYL